jgi:SpoVK/Ycf46/Vps4 family AAA+-type ATPase
VEIEKMHHNWLNCHCIYFSKIAEAREKEKEYWKHKVVVEDDSYDELGRPKQKIALLHGPPGLGKTTAAHVVARHAGKCDTSSSPTLISFTRTMILIISPSSRCFLIFHEFIRI